MATMALWQWRSSLLVALLWACSAAAKAAAVRTSSSFSSGTTTTPTTTAGFLSSACYYSSSSGLTNGAASRTCSGVAPHAVGSHRRVKVCTPGGRGEDSRRRVGGERVSTRWMMTDASIGVSVSGVGDVAIGREEAVAAEEGKKREMTKSVLLGVFGEVAGSAVDANQSVSDTTGESPSSGGLDSSASSLFVDPVLACPSTLGPLMEGIRLYGSNRFGIVRYKATSKRPGVKYLDNGVYTDFIEEERPSRTRDVRKNAMEGTFQSPLVAWLYERGWRQSFDTYGFPGIDEEFKLVTEFLGNADGGTVLDVSCGSGLMTRRLTASNRYSRVIGGDLSITMLDETAKRFKQNNLDRPELIRCDVSKLPVRTESVDGIHAGAALHCWTKLEEALSEMHRVLKPGKGFFATTFLSVDNVSPWIRNRYNSFEMDELKRLMVDAGFNEVEVTKNGRACAIIKVRKGEE